MTSPMSMLGADTGQLEALAARLGSSTERIAEVRVRSNTAAINAVEALTGSFDGTITEIEGAMTELQTEMTAAHGEMASTTWTGTNATSFDAGFTEFNNAMVVLGESVSGGYATELKSRLAAVTAEIELFQASVSGALEQAGMSTESMRAAVQQQGVVLDQAMNGSMTFGGDAATSRVG